jgi:hypothetical protein
MSVPFYQLWVVVILATVTNAHFEKGTRKPIIKLKPAKTGEELWFRSSSEKKT